MKSVAWLCLTLALASCVSVNKTVLDRSMSATPVPAEDVYVYLPGDTIPEHRRIAILNASGDADVVNEGQIMDKLREEAGKLGANAIIMGEIENPGTGARVAEAVFGTSAERRTQAIAVFVPSLRPGGPGGPGGHGDTR